MAKSSNSDRPLGETNASKELEELAASAAEHEELGGIVWRYIEATQGGEKMAKADCLAMASSKTVADEADRLLDVASLLFLKKKQGE